MHIDLTKLFPRVTAMIINIDREPVGRNTKLDTKVYRSHRYIHSPSIIAPTAMRSFLFISMIGDGDIHIKDNKQQNYLLLTKEQRHLLSNPNSHD
jgi:hypothetical protein